MHAGSSGLQEEDFVGLGMPVSIDFLSYRDARRKQDQMRGSAILWVNLEDEGLSWIRVARPSPHHTALAFVLLED
jgi:hypothetical protein